ncbi:MerR family transcriptional regulator [Sporosalibacterium faouarense]|uniref:MerR family transcriptional regulator n=1 Tax=Sporosalibacterium faouarense TaxID=516123 RepID=UPI00141C828C|nr:MerR family transcriptional regulator [Sporosalibacterium faouarense]MTI46383.1 MerR family transcriptional regulator [Bacillota bacterium]
MQKENRFSVGDVARLTGVTIRTLQYYDNIGLVPLERETTNGNRYYRESDLTRLQQVLFYKSLGLKIEDIKNLLVETVTIEQLISVLEKQKDIFYNKLNDLKSSIAYIEASLVSLEENNSIHWGNLIQLIVSLNKETVFEYEDVEYDKHTENIFTKYYDNTEAVMEVYWDWKKLILEAISHILNDVQPGSRQGQIFAKKWVDMILQITNGREDLLEAHKTSYENRGQWPEEDRRLMEFANNFIDKATEVYLSSDKNKGLEGEYDKN